MKTLQLSVLAVLIIFCSLDSSIAAKSDHGHGSEPLANASPATDIPRIAAQSEGYKLVGSFKDGLLTLHLKRKPDGSPVAGAKIELTIDGETGAAEAKANGVYTYRFAGLKKGAEREVIVTIIEGNKNDLLIGVLKKSHESAGPANHGAHAGHASHGADAGHASEGGHGAHGGRGPEGVVKLTPEVMREFGVATERVGPGTIANSITRPAEISFNMDRFMHVVPRVAGIAKSIMAKQGEAVTEGQILAVLESRELAELKAAYLAALERLALAKDDFERVQTLRQKNITSEKSFLTSRAAFAEARIAVRSAKQKLNSIGINDKVLAEIVKAPDSILTEYTMRAPMSGMVVKRHLVQGESVPTNRDAFVVADMSTVWVNISIYAGDYAKVDPGQNVTLETEGGQTAEGSISFVTPDVSEQTRTATARVILKLPPRGFRPGMFIKAKIDVSRTDVGVRIPKTALHTHEGKEVVFANESGAFKPVAVMIGRRNGRYAEVVSGLKAGAIIAAEGSFLIKSQLSKASFGDGHNH